MHFFEYVYQTAKAPQVDTGFRLVKNGKFGAARQNRGDFYPFKLAARKRRVYLAVDIIARTKTYLGKIIASVGNAYISSGGYAYNIVYGNTLKPYRLLKAETTPSSSI